MDKNIYEQCVDIVRKAVDYMRKHQTTEDAEMLCCYYMLLSRVNVFTIRTFTNELNRIKNTYHLEASCRHYSDEYADEFLQPIEGVRVLLAKCKHFHDLNPLRYVDKIQITCATESNIP